MSTVEIKVCGRELCFTNMPTISAGAEGVDSIKFEFETESIWNGYSKTCIIFKNRGQYYPEVLDNNNVAKISSKVLQNEGIIYIGLCGTKENTRLTSTIVSYKIEHGVYYFGTAEDEEFVKTNFEQILEYYRTVEAEQKIINSRLSSLENPNYTKDDIGKLLSVGSNKKVGLQQVNNNKFELTDEGLDLKPGTGYKWFAERVDGSLALNGTLFNVKTFGAIGDGKTDDGWAIQSTIENCKGLFGGGTIYFPKGIYNITRTLFYYSNMTFKFERGAVIRTMKDTVHGCRTPSIIFAPYFETKIAFLNGTDEDGNAYDTSGFTSNRYGVENVVFDGGTIDGLTWNGGDVNNTVADKGFVNLTCYCRNIKFLNMTFKNNHGGHSIEINSSTDVLVRDCRFLNYVYSGDGRYKEDLQIDAATCSSIGSDYKIEEHTSGFKAPNGETYNWWYSYESGSYGYSMLGGYFDFTLLPPGNHYTADTYQKPINDKLGMSTSAITAAKGFHQCCHNIEIVSCYFENNDTDCRVSAIGNHTFFNSSSTDEKFANENHDKHSGIKIHDNTFVWSENKGTGDSEFYRGVIAFGHKESGSWVNQHIYNAVIYGNIFYRNKSFMIGNDSTDGETKEGYAISIARGDSGAVYKYTSENPRCPQTKYRIFGNLYLGIHGWETAATIYQNGNTLVIQ